MLQRRKLPRISTCLAALCAAGFSAAPAAADVFSWRTEDGTYAFADDAEHVPARYAAEARRVPRAGLDGYARYTAQDTTVTRSYNERLAARLAYLRELNAAPAPAPAVAASGSPGVIAIPTGGDNSPEIAVPLQGEGAEPVIITPVIAKRLGEARTRRATVVRRGDQVVAVIKGERHVFDPSVDIHDEEALEDGTDLGR